MYELMLEIAWTTQPIDTSRWVQAFISRRYGRVPPAIAQAWDILGANVYSNPKYETIMAVVKSIAELRPQQGGMIVDGHHPTELFYDPKLLYAFFALFLEIPSTSSAKATFVHLSP